MSYAGTAINVSGGSGETLVFNNNTFTDNGTAISTSAATTTNEQIENNSFVNNNQAIHALSNWSTIGATVGQVGISCFYLPTVLATGNTFGPNHSPTPLLSQDDYNTSIGASALGALAAAFGVPSVQDYPDGWIGTTQPSQTDTVNVEHMLCIDAVVPASSYVALATPLNFAGDVIIPVGVSSAQRRSFSNHRVQQDRRLNFGLKLVRSPRAQSNGLGRDWQQLNFGTTPTEANLRRDSLSRPRRFKSVAREIPHRHK
jgi:hypothetical protein